MTTDGGDDPPTFSRPPPPLPGLVLPPLREPVFSQLAVEEGFTASGIDDDGPITDVDDEPPTFSIAPGPPQEVGVVTLVNAAPPHERLKARVVTADATHLFVAVEGEPAARRISRVACFEHPVGGGWSTWRLSGADRERWVVAAAAAPSEGSA
jgi:hypothetical protein